MHTEPNTSTDIDPGLIADRIVTAAALLDSVAAMSGAYSSRLNVGQVRDHRILIELRRRGWKIMHRQNGSEWFDAVLATGARGDLTEHCVSFFVDKGAERQADELARLAEAE